MRRPLAVKMAEPVLCGYDGPAQVGTGYSPLIQMATVRVLLDACSR